MDVDGAGGERELRGWVLAVGALGLAACVGLSARPEALPEGLRPEGLRTLGCAWMMAWWWIGSGLPLAIPSLVPLALFPLLGIADSKAVAQPYAHRMVLLLLCGFLLALAVEKWNLHRRLALRVLVTVGRSPLGLVAAVMGITALLSMWISNTATTLMMLPIVLALAASAQAVNESEAANRRFGQLLVLALAYSASIGGMATPVGTPPNLIFAGVYEKQFPDAIAVDFGAWMAVGLPVSICLLVLVFVLLGRVLLPLPADYQLGDRGALRARLDALGDWRRPELRVAVGFGVTCFLWVFRKQLGFPPAVHDSTVAAAMVVLFFLAPSGGGEKESKQLLVWSDAVRVPWGLLLLFGGGIALSMGFQQSGLTEWMGGLLAGLATLPPLVTVVGICLAVTFLTEMTSNTATTALILPVLAATAKATGLSPLTLMIPATLAASCAFMLPVATAPNAIVVGSGAVDQNTMVRTGLVLNLSCALPVAVLVLLLT